MVSTVSRLLFIIDVGNFKSFNLGKVFCFSRLTDLDAFEFSPKENPWSGVITLKTNKENESSICVALAI